METSKTKTHRHRCCKPGYRGELCELLEVLLRNPWDFFDKNDCLNSDGRRLFETLLRLLLDEHHRYRKLARETRKQPCLENILRLSRIFYDCDAHGLYIESRSRYYYWTP